MQTISGKQLKYWGLIGLLVSVFDHIVKGVYPSIINSGISFGLGFSLNNLWLGIYLLIGLATIYLLFRKSQSGKILATLLVLSSSNIIDRIVFGGVRDFINFAGLYFNLTDIAINLFILWIVFLTLKTK